ncbi:hypothetical protein PAMP_006327 [Pampus punctatissimus]
MNLVLLISPVSYKSTVGRLKALRTEIEHLQLLLERAKVKLQKDFHKWWSLEASSMQESASEAAARCQTGSPRTTLQMSLTGTPDIGAPGLSSTVQNYPAGRDPEPDRSTSPDQGLRSFIPKSVPPLTAAPSWHDKPTDRRVTDIAPSSEWRSLSTTALSSSSLQLTGDKQADADIMAFVRARQNLLKRTDPPPQ